MIEMQAAQLSRYGIEIYPSFACKMKNLFNNNIETSVKTDTFRIA